MEKNNIMQQNRNHTWDFFYWNETSVSN
jgi:hypothetical protein